MQLLTLETFLPLLEPFANRELLTPAESLQVTLLVTELLVDDYVDFRLLKFLSRFFTQQSYDDVIEERNIEHECGYVMCNNQPKSLVRRLSLNSNGTTIAHISDSGASTKYQIYNRKPSIILPNTYLSQYCCKEHYQASVFYRNQLSKEALFARKDITVVPPYAGDQNFYENSITLLEEVIAKHKELKQEGKSMAEVIAMMNGLSVCEHEMNEDTIKLIKMIEDFDIVEREAVSEHGVKDKLFEADNDNDDDDGDDEKEDSKRLSHSRNIEGYVTTNKSFGGYVV
ncbi:hypothetical protein KGF56_004375 [Candida oxycetoniae]|uniref:RNA polymerase II subunit B1 CTD phosphatase RPAP2 homolog n=1 Tax=Candida oxycetoniae TaxID=497107 RepID=A0AAI9SUG8_9ASCO|nr:uncharacterized protein KGF56_004375 [Candida oxycetoniae]KAI3402914.2 hypothetical protein KGF56_004375 [Candida oxycetoniae]